MSQNKANNFQRIRALPKKQQAILSLMLLQRMLPNYQLFVAVTEFPQPHQIDNIMNSLWERLLIQGAKLNFAALEEKVEALTPDEAAYDMYGVYPAIYFCTGLLTYIAGEQNDDEYDAVAIAKVSQGCIVHLIEYQAGEQELDNTAIREHELMVREVELLTELIDWVETLNLKKVSANDIKKQALSKALADGMSNIGIELD
ncbi:YjaG family protein [Psychrosphaera ytuae]|uniref:YjaG family protein n=1 Tax=Psychrosphaera ytuae TaxID=2820710 RepID=A0A975DBN1_9GAMM|nr:YjaG family protein [Psychrosphaera ytuae]QTH62680.1 YjaG family protein [Psychrosphaera ytuae]